MKTNNAIQKVNRVFSYILVAEDDKDDQELLKDALDEINLDLSKVQFVEDGEQLISSLNNALTLPSLILLDLNMPRMNGMQALVEIKTSKTLRHLPVIIFSTSDDSENIKQCYSLGSNAYMLKPNDFSSLVSAMQIMTDYWFERAQIIQ